MHQQHRVVISLWTWPEPVDWKVSDSHCLANNDIDTPYSVVNRLFFIQKIPCWCILMMGGEKRQSAASMAQEATKSTKKSKHHSYLEVVENVNKKNPLDVQVWSAYLLLLVEHWLTKEQHTQDSTPPPGYAFLGIGKPELTQTCRDMSRERGAMVFIVSVRVILIPVS